MNDDVRDLEIECNQLAAEFLALNWGNAKPKVRAAVTEMLSGSKLFTSSMAWLLKETTKLPAQAEPARRLHELVMAISALRARKTRNDFFTLRDSERGAA